MMKSIIFQTLTTLTLMSTLFPFGAEAQSTGTKAVFNKNSVDLTRRSSFEVDPVTQALNIQIDLQEYGGRGIGTPVSLRWNSKLWRMQDEGCFWYDNPDTPPTHMTQPMYSEYGVSGWTSTLDVPSFEWIMGPFTVWAGTGGVIQYQYTEGRPWDCVDDQPMPNDCYENNPSCDSWPARFYVKRLMLHMPDGGSHELRQSDTVFPETFLSGTDTYRAVDGSGVLYDDANKTLFLPDGSRYIKNQGEVYHFDRNGNKRTYTGSTNSWTDTLGRTFVSPTSPQHGPSGTLVTPGIGADLEYALTWEPLEDAFTDPNDQLRYKAADTVNGMTRQSWSPYLFGGDNLDLAAGPGDSNPFLFNPTVLTKIVLPDGRNYEFSYNAYGEIDKIVLPTGAYKRYRYEALEPRFGGTNSYTQVNRGVVEMWESPTGDPNEESSHHWEFDGAKVYPDYVITTTAPDGTYTKRTVKVDGAASSRGWGFNWGPEGRIIDEQVFSASDELLGRTLFTYTHDGPIYDPSGSTTTGLATEPFDTHPVQGASRNTRLTVRRDILVEGTDALAKTTTYEYDADINVTATNEHDFISISYATATASNPTISAGTLLRRTETTYLLGDANVAQQTKDAYRARNLIRLPTQTLVKDGSGNVKAKTHIFYDEVGTYPLLTDVSSTRWEDPNTNYRGLVTTTKSWSDIANNLFVTTHAQYDRLGNARKSWDGNGNLSQIEYSSTYDHAYPTKTISPDPDGAGAITPLETTVVYDYNTGLPTSTTDVNGQTTQVFYEDPLLRPTKVIAPNGHQTITEYGAGTSESTRFIKSRSQIDETNWKEAYSWYDGLGRTVLNQSVENSADDIFAVICYDNMGRVSKATNPFRGYTNQDCTTTTGLEWTSNIYDTAGRPWKLKTPDNAEVVINYGLATAGSTIGTSVTGTDQAGKLRRSVTNALGQLKRVDEPNDAGQLGTVASPNQPTAYTYDILNNLTTVTQAGTGTEQCGPSGGTCSQTRTFAYDSLSRLLSAANPESGTINYIYDNNGNLTQKTDARGVQTDYVYDALSRVTNRNYSTPGGTPSNYQATPNVTYTYDDPLIANSKGQLTKVASGISTTEYVTFDILGRVTRSKQTTDGVVYGDDANPMTYTYNLSGALIEQKYPSGRVVKNVIDNEGDLSMVQSKKNQNFGYHTYVANFTYNAAGAATSLQLGNGKWESTTFNSRLQPTQIALGTVQNGTDKLKLDYEYGALNLGTGETIAGTNNGNVSKQTITVATVGANPGFVATQYYAYDSLNRIQIATENIAPSGQPVQLSWRQQFTYDRYGNRNFDEANTTTLPKECNGNTEVCEAIRSIVNPSVNTANNKLNGYTFDSSGNTTQDAQLRKFTYDRENKQVKVEMVDSGGIVTGTVGEYIYDGDGKRVKKKGYTNNILTEETTFVYDATGRLVAEYSSDIVSVNDARVAYLTNDHLGSPRINANQNGSIIARHDYHPFGEEIGTLAPPYNGAIHRAANLGYTADTVRKQFTGYLKDNETNLDFAEARMYQNLHGRFTAIDPLLSSSKSADPQTWNRYPYVLGNPLRLVDPTGKSPSTHIDENGKVIAVIDDDDLSVYQHKNNADGKAPTEYMIKKRQEKSGSTSAGGTKIGETLIWHEFREHDKAGNPTSRIAPGAQIIRGFDFSPVVTALNAHARTLTLGTVMNLSKNNQPFDIKTNQTLAPHGVNTGGLLFGKFVTARSAGNFLAGMNGATVSTNSYVNDYLSQDAYMRVAGEYEQTGKMDATTAAGLRTGAITPTVNKAPLYGESSYSGTYIIWGFETGRSMR